MLSEKQQTSLAPQFAVSNWQSSLLDHHPDALYVVIDDKLEYANLAGLALLKVSDLKQLPNLALDQILLSEHPEHTRPIRSELSKLKQQEEFCCRCLCSDGQSREVEIKVTRLPALAESALILSVRELHMRQQHYARHLVNAEQKAQRVHDALHHEKEILEMIALDKPLTDILEDVCDRLERLLENGALCAISLYDTGNNILCLGAAPSLPGAFADLMAYVRINDKSGSAAAALHFNRPVIVGDISLSPLWQSFAPQMASMGLRACWSIPIKTKFNSVMGTIDVYHRHHYTPSDDEQAAVTDASDLIGLAIDKKNMEQSLEESEERYRSVVTNLTEGIMVVAPGGQILTCNPSAQRILKIEDISRVGRRHRYFKNIFNDEGEMIKLGEDPASMAFRRAEPILNLSLGLELRDNSVVWLVVNVLPIRKKNSPLVSAVLISFTDTTEVRDTQRRLHFMASYDALTGLPNRHHLNQRLNSALQDAKRLQQKLAVLFLDLDRFKNVNDTAGHAAGDTLLRDVARRLSSCIRSSDLLARLGGDEFVIVAENFEDAQHLKDLAERVLARMREPFDIEGNEYHLGTSIGISVYPHDGDDSATMLRCADSAMYLAKELGRNNYQFFTTELNVRAQHRYALETNLRRALTEQEFLVYFQPKYCLEDARIVGAEALLRWHLPDLGLIPPQDFIPIAEETGLILPLGRWVIAEVCRLTKKWQELYQSDLVVSVNISPKQFHDAGLTRFIEQILLETGLQPKSLQLEITEGLLMGEVETLLPMFTELKALGLSIALDDFGTGFSSLSYLQRFPIDYLKIDRSFIRDIPGNSDSVVLTHAIIAMAKALGLNITAEGVEKAEQVLFLHESGCQEMQGYYFSHPLPVNEFEILLRDKIKLWQD